MRYFLKEFGDRVFAGCTSIRHVSMCARVTQRCLDIFESGKTLLKISEDVDTLPYKAFNGMSALERVGLPAGLRELVDGAFAGTAVRVVAIPYAHCMPSQKDWDPIYIYPSAQQVTGLVMERSLLYRSDLTNIVYRGDLNDLPTCARMPALRGFTRLMSLGREDLSSWLDSYARQDKRLQVSLAEVSEANFPVILKLNMVSAGALPEIRELLEKRRNVEQMALLLEYEQRIPESEKRRAEEAMALGFERQLAQMSRSADRKANARGIAGLTFVVKSPIERLGIYRRDTGITNNWEAFRGFIESCGDFLRSDISSRTDYLIANPLLDGSAKVRKAQELGIEIISEDDFLHMALS